MHYLYVGFMVAAGFWLFGVLLNNAAIIWDLGKVVFLLGIPIVLFVVGLVGITLGARAANQWVAERQLQSDIHPAPPVTSPAPTNVPIPSAGPSAPAVTASLAKAQVPAPANSPTPEQVCAHTEYLPLAKPKLYSDCVNFWNVYRTSRKTDHRAVESAMRFAMTTTNKAQNLCIFEVLTGESWKQTSADAKEDAFRSCIEKNRRYDSVR